MDDSAHNNTTSPLQTPHRIKVYSVSQSGPSVNKIMYILYGSYRVVTQNTCLCNHSLRTTAAIIITTANSYRFA